MSRDPLGTLSSIARQCGDIAYFKLRRGSLFFINNPESIRDVLVTKQQHFIKSDGTRIAKSIMGEGILTSEGDFHRRQRKLVQSGFRHEKIASYSNIIVESADGISKSWNSHQLIDVQAEMTRLSLMIVARALFNADIKVDSNDAAFIHSLESVHGIKQSRASALRGFWKKNRQGLKQSREALDSMIYEMISKRRKGGEDFGDLLSTLLQARDPEENQEPMSDVQVRDEVMTLFLAAHETTAMALMWTWYLLSQNHDVEKKVHSEVDSVLNGRLPSASDFPRLGYINQVLTESLRMYPPAWLTGRKAVTDVVVGGYTLPAGSNVIISQYHMHHDARYFREPENFSPERWTPEFRSALPKFSYFPFGAGPRACIGEPLVWMEAAMIIAIIAQRWRLRPASDERIEPLARLSLPPEYILVRPLRPNHKVQMYCTERQISES